MELNSQFFEIGDAISLIAKGKLVLPEFQRDFEWAPAAIADLLRTIVRKWPAGTLLFLKSDGELLLAPKSIELAPDPLAPEFFILDGQQRLTSVYHAFEEQGDDIYYIDMAAVLTAMEFEDEHLLSEKKTKFVKRFPSTESKAKKRVLEVGAIRDDVRFGDWCDHLPPEERQSYRKLRATVLSGLTNYRFPALVLGKEMPLQAIAKIFETINKTGVRLAFLDLMVAKLYPLDFRLRDKIREARDQFSILRDFSFEGHGPLQLLALGDHFRQAQARQQRLANGDKNVPSVKVKGIREGDMLAMDPQYVRANWDDAVQRYVNALTFLQTRCGVRSGALLPSDAMVVAMAYALALPTTRPGFDKDLERWFWCATFGQVYAQGANTQVVRDAKELHAWSASEQAPPSAVRERPSTDAVRLLLQESRRRNEMALRGTMALLVLRDARDWCTGELLRDMRAGEIEFHHIFPDNYLKKRSVAVPDKIVNFAPISGATNASLRDIPPGEALKRDDVKAHAVDSHRVVRELLERNDYAGHDAGRGERLMDLLESLLR